MRIQRLREHELWGETMSGFGDLSARLARARRKLAQQHAAYAAAEAAARKTAPQTSATIIPFPAATSARSRMLSAKAQVISFPEGRLRVG